MKTFIVWIKNALSSSPDASPNRIQASTPEAAERIFWAKIKPKDRGRISIVKIEEAKG